MDPRIEKMAAVLTEYSVAIRENDLAWIRYQPLAEEAALAAYEKVIEMGGNPVVQVMPYPFDEVLLRKGSDAQLDFGDPITEWLTTNADVRMTFGAPQNSRALSSVDPARMARQRTAMKNIIETFMHRQGAGELRWVGTRLPTESAAQDAEMSLSEYEDFVFNACKLHLDDPVAAWKAVAIEQQHLVDWLKGKQDVHVTGDNIDLKLSIAGRTFINADGKKNFPDGEIFTGPVEDSVNGWVRFTYPAIYSGREVDGVELEFKDGKVVKATAAKGEDFLNSVLDTDAGSRILGEFAIGTNREIQQFTRSILFDEKIGGTVHMAVGAGYPDTGSTNKSAVHWDMICDMRSGGEITVDGALFYKDGEFQV